MKKPSKKAPPGYVNPHADDNLEELPRLQRTIGQLDGVKRMIEERRHCYEVIYQLRAIQSALKALEGKILENHLEHLLDEVTNHAQSARYKEKREDLINVVKGKLLIAP
ncbi:MAG: metal-sensitive transcriptional regulator [Proteobacteria bacterium]|nr:MAG: metal-sensitive transcriptional regulator [Pseudomonadota bacterium]